MKLSDFVMTHKKGKTALDIEFFAEVSVSTGALFWKRTERRKIRREYAGSWHFVDSGEFLPGYEGEKLERAYKAQVSLESASRSNEV